MMRAILVLWTLLVTLAMGQMQSGAQSDVQSGPPTGKCYRKEYCRAPNDKRLSSEKDPSNSQKCELYVATYDHEGKIISESCHTRYEGWGCDCSKCCSCSNTTKPDAGDKDPDKKKPDNGGNKDPDEKKPDNGGDKDPDEKKPDNGGNKDPDEKKPDNGGNKDPDKKPDDKKPNKLQNTDTHVSACLCQGDQKPVMQELENPCRCSCPAMHGATQKYNGRTYMLNCKQAYRSEDVAKKTGLKSLSDCGNECSTWPKCVAVNFYLEEDGNSRCILHTARGEPVDESSSSFGGSLVQV